MLFRSSFVAEWAKSRVKKNRATNTCIHNNGINNDTSASASTSAPSDNIHSAQGVDNPSSVPLKPAVPPLGSLTVQMGEFVKVYSSPEQEGQFDSVVTCFFIDTAGDILEYLAVIAHVLRPGEGCNTVIFVSK